MEAPHFMKDLWTTITLDAKSRVVQIANPDDRLFFGKTPVTGKTISESFPLDEQGREQAAQIDDGIRRAQSEKRNVYLTYRSLAGGEQIYVSMFAEYRTEGICLHATAIDAGDMQRAAKNSADSEEKMILDKNIYERLPVGVEIYDGNGYLIEINQQELDAMGITDKQTVLGVNLFENPNLTDNIKAQLEAGEEVQFTSDYNFSKATEIGYYPTTKSGNRLLTTSISVIHDSAGKIDKYLLISQDVTERVKYQREYEALYNQSMTILNSLPVGVEIYSSDGVLLYLNESDCRFFGVDSSQVLAINLNIDDNPNLPQEVKDAVHRGEPTITRFPYSFNAVSERNYYSTSQAEKVLQIECTGQPVIGPGGRIENYVFIVQDVTDDVRREEELRQSKQKTEVAIYDADVTIWEFDAKRCQFFSDNEPLNRYDSKKPLTIKDYTEPVHEDDQAMIQDVIRRMTEGEDWQFRVDIRVKFPDFSEWQYCTVSGTPYERDAQGRVVKYVGSRKNNTEIQQRKILQENILNSIPISIHIKDVEDNCRYVFCNEESSRLFGSSIDKTIYDVMDEAEVARIEKTDKEVFSTGSPYFGLEHIELSDGRSYDTLVRKSIIYDGNKRLLLNVRWDQTLRNDLERRAKVLSLSMQAMNAYTWYYDIAKDRISYGEGFERTERKSTYINSLQKFIAALHPDDKLQFTKNVQGVIETQNSEWTTEYRIDLSGSGNYEWWETRGMLESTVINDIHHKYMIGMSVNIDSHKKTELALLKNEQELSLLIRQNELVLNNTNSGLAYITRDYVVQWENISICSASLSYEAYKKGEHCFKSAHGRTSPCENCVLDRAFKSRQTEQIKFSLNNERTMEVFGTPVLNESGEVEGIVIRVDDITEREQMIRELKQAKALAEQSDKLKSAFLANMSHEIRTPLNAIVGFSELLITAEEGEERDEYIQIINNNNELLLKLINDILDLSKIEAGSVELKYEEFDLSEYFDGMAASMKQRITNPNVRLIAENAYPACIVKLDRNRIAQILTNYVTNAIKYTPKGFIEMGYECVDIGVRFYVKDSGIGILDEKKDKVFHRFEKLDEFAQGTGLGLSICKAIAESMGGTVGFDSNYGEGSIFWAVLPCDPEIQSESVAGESRKGDNTNVESTDTTAQVEYERKTILVAEDIASNYLLISALLKKNFDLLHAKNGQEAVEIARNHHADLVLMDMKMPVMDGLTATAEIRKSNPKLPIVALTAHAFDADRQAALAAGCNDYLVKPIDKVKLMAVLRKYGLAPKIGK